MLLADVASGVRAKIVGKTVQLRHGRLNGCFCGEQAASGKTPKAPFAVCILSVVCKNYSMRIFANVFAVKNCGVFSATQLLSQKIYDAF